MRITLILLLFTTSLFAQTKYPYKSFINGDTVCILSIPQVTKLNLSFIKLDFETQLADSFRVILNKQNELIQFKDSKIITYDNLIKINQKVINNDESRIVIYKELDLINQRKIKWLRVQRNVLAIAVIATLSKIFIFH